jgi:hypothetical protein
LLISWRLGATAASAQALQADQRGETAAGEVSDGKEGDDGRGLTGAGF